MEEIRLARKIRRAKKNRRFAYMIVSPSNGLTDKMFLSSRRAHVVLDDLRMKGYYGKKTGRVVKLLVLDYGVDVLISKNGKCVAVKRIKVKKK
jgi:hypothetical protein